MCMDSRSGPELPNKVHRFGRTVKRCPTNTHRLPFGTVAALATLLALAPGCGPDPKQAEGALAQAAQAASARDGTAMFQALDERARHAMAAVVKARAQAKSAIHKSYPEEAQAEALRALGDAAEVDTPEALFLRRCPQACLDELAQRLSAPREVRHEGPLAVVEMVRGGQVQLYRGKDERYGLVWNTEALMRESRRAFAELDLVRKNAELYEKQRKLE